MQRSEEETRGVLTSSGTARSQAHLFIRWAREKQMTYHNDTT